MQIKELFKLAKNGNSHCEVPKLEAKGIYIYYEFNSEKKDFVEGCIKFNNIHGYRYTRGPSCTLDMIKAYDRILEIENSPWAKELSERRKKSKIDITVPLPEMHHYMVYFDDEGCYEVVAKSFEVTEDL